MSDYPLPRGRFVEAARLFLGRGEKLKWLDRFRMEDKVRPDSALRELETGDGNDQLLAPVTSLLVDLEANISALTPASNRNKIKYTCRGCGCNVWGRPGLRIRCEDCDVSLEICP